jgi:hypothetical protein
MKGFRKHIAASVSITAVFVICALAISISAVPLSTTPVQASQGTQTASFTDLAEALDEAYGKALAEEPAAPATAGGVATQPAPATVVPQSAPAASQPVAEPAPAVSQPQDPDPQLATPKKPPGGTINPPANLKGAFVTVMPPYVELAWNGNNSKKDLDYFLVYREDVAKPGQISVVQAKKEENYDDYDIVPGSTYRYWVTAVAKWGEESGPSNRVEVVTQSTQTPAPPQDVVAAAIDPGVSFDWQPNGEPNLAGYNVYYSYHDRWRKLNDAVLTDNHYYYDEGSAGQTYAVSAVNVFGIESGYVMVVAQAAAPTLYQENDPAVSVEGMWAIESYQGASGGSIRVAGTAGERLHFAFTGRQVKLIAANYWTCGSARIYIDGELMATVNMYSFDPVFQSIDVSVPGLKYGKHMLTVEVVGSGNPETTFNFVNVDAFEVR